MSKRFFSVQAIQNLDSLTLTPDDLDEMKEKFTNASKIYIKAQIKQTVTVVNYLLVMVSDLNRPKEKSDLAATMKKARKADNVEAVKREIT